MTVVPFRKNETWNAESRDDLASTYRDAIFEHIRAHTVGTNINPTTLLTTDYLNHFNEVVMLLEMLPAAPGELAADLSKWSPMSYEEHFDESGFRDKALAVAAYENAPVQVREAFDLAVADLDQEMVLALQEVEKLVDTGNIDALQSLCGKCVPELQSLIMHVAAIVNGGPDEAAEVEADAHAGDEAQAAVDALFD